MAILLIPPLTAESTHHNQIFFQNYHIQLPVDHNQTRNKEACLQVLDNSILLRLLTFSLVLDMSPRSLQFLIQDF